MNLAGGRPRVAPIQLLVKPNIMHKGWSVSLFQAVSPLAHHSCEGSGEPCDITSCCNLTSSAKALMSLGLSHYTYQAAQILSDCRNSNLERKRPKVKRHQRMRGKASGILTCRPAPLSIGQRCRGAGHKGH